MNSTLQFIICHKFTDNIYFEICPSHENTLSNCVHAPKHGVPNINFIAVVLYNPLSTKLTK